METRGTAAAAAAAGLVAAQASPLEHGGRHAPDARAVRSAAGAAVRAVACGVAGTGSKAGTTFRRWKRAKEKYDL